jgi:hypothetical protein
MRLRASTALVLVCASLAWLGWVRQRADTDQQLAALRLEIASLNSASAAVRAREQSIRESNAPITVAAELKVGGTSAKAVQHKLEPLALAQPRARKPPKATEDVALTEPGSAQDPEQQAAIATGQRGECSSHPVVFWHYPKTGMWQNPVL